jgi:hypothetical protein
MLLCVVLKVHEHLQRIFERLLILSIERHLDKSACAPFVERTLYL